MTYTASKLGGLSGAAIGGLLSLLCGCLYLSPVAMSAGVLAILFMTVWGWTGRC